MSDTFGMKRGRGPLQRFTDSERKRRHAERQRIYRRTTVNIGKEFFRWETLRMRLGLSSHVVMAKELIDHYVTVAPSQSNESFEASGSDVSPDNEEYNESYESLQLSVSETSPEYNEFPKHDSCESDSKTSKDQPRPKTTSVISAPSQNNESIQPNVSEFAEDKSHETYEPLQLSVSEIPPEYDKSQESHESVSKATIVTSTPSQSHQSFQPGLSQIQESVSKAKRVSPSVKASNVMFTPSQSYQPFHSSLSQILPGQESHKRADNYRVLKGRDQWFIKRKMTSRDTTSEKNAPVALFRNKFLPVMKDTNYSKISSLTDRTNDTLPQHTSAQSYHYAPPVPVSFSHPELVNIRTNSSADGNLPREDDIQDVTKVKIETGSDIAQKVEVMVPSAHETIDRISCDIYSDEFDVSDVSDASSDIAQKSTQEHHTLRRSSRSCVKKVKKKLKLIAKTLTKTGRNDQNLEKKVSVKKENDDNYQPDDSLVDFANKNYKSQCLIVNTKHKSAIIDGKECPAANKTIGQKKENAKLKKMKKRKMLNSAKFERLDDGTFQCSFCQDIFVSDENEEEHCSKHLGYFRCKFCSFSCDLKQIFFNHTRKKHNDKNCSNKKKENAKIRKVSTEKVKKMLTSAKFEKLDDGTFQCTLCQDIFSSDENEEEHCSWHLGFFKCNVCGELFSTETGLKVHQNSKCGEGNVDETGNTFQCKFCSFSCDLKQPFLNHMRKKHNDQSYSNNKTSYLCDACGLAFNSRYTMTGHVCTSKSCMWLCPICGEQFSGNQKMKRHRLTHNEKNVNCCMEGCEKIFYTQGLMLQHYRRSHQPKKHNFVCTFEQCGKRFPHSSCLNQHIDSVHLKNRVFMCDWPDCGKCFTMEWHLKVHMRIHKGENPIECQFCDYKCRQRASLKWHLRKHGIFNREQEKAALEQLNTEEDMQ